MWGESGFPLGCMWVVPSGTHCGCHCWLSLCRTDPSERTQQPVCMCLYKCPLLTLGCGCVMHLTFRWRGELWRKAPRCSRTEAACSGTGCIRRVARTQRCGPWSACTPAEVGTAPCYSHSIVSCPEGDRWPCPGGTENPGKLPSSRQPPKRKGWVLRKASPGDTYLTVIYITREIFLLSFNCPS